MFIDQNTILLYNDICRFTRSIYIKGLTETEEEHMGSLMVGILAGLCLVASGYCYWQKRQFNDNVDNLAKTKTTSVIVTQVTIGAMDKAVAEAKKWSIKGEGFAFATALLGLVALAMFLQGL